MSPFLCLNEPGTRRWKRPRNTSFRAWLAKEVHISSSTLGMEFFLKKLSHNSTKQELAWIRPGWSLSPNSRVRSATPSLPKLLKPKHCEFKVNFYLQLPFHQKGTWQSKTEGPPVHLYGTWMQSHHEERSPHAARSTLTSIQRDAAHHQAAASRQDCEAKVLHDVPQGWSAKNLPSRWTRAWWSIFKLSLCTGLVVLVNC